MHGTRGPQHVCRTTAGPGGRTPAPPIFSMMLGAVSNVLALGLLAQAAGCLRRCRSAATFLLFTASLLATDLAGHVIPGAWCCACEPGWARCCGRGACHFLGGCMVFSLCPLLLGCGMAVERWVGVMAAVARSPRLGGPCAAGSGSAGRRGLGRGSAAAGAL